MNDALCANDQDGSTAWRKHSLYLPDVEGLKSWDVIDVLKLTGNPKQVIPPKPGISNASKKVKDQLTADPYNMFLINELSIIYCSEAHLDKAAAVLVRGWKRASEIPDQSVRFRFLMKLCEISFKLGKYYQADAVMRDIMNEEPEDPKELRSYLVLACRVLSNRPEKARSASDLVLTLKFFQRAIDGVDNDVAVRILALTQMDLKKIGGYEAAKTAVEKVVTTERDKSDIEMLSHFKERCENAPKTQDNLERNLMIGGGVFFGLIFFYILYTLEKWSLAKLQ